MVVTALETLFYPKRKEHSFVSFTTIRNIWLGTIRTRRIDLVYTETTCSRMPKDSDIG